MKYLNLLVLRCRDLEASRRFYEVLGMRFTKHAHGGGPEHWAHEEEGRVFELYPAQEGESADRTGLGFFADSLEEASERFIERGFSPQRIATNPWGRTFVVRDPDGRRVEVKATV